MKNTLQSRYLKLPSIFMFLFLFTCCISGFAQRGDVSNMKGTNTVQSADFFKIPNYRGLSNQKGLMVFQDQRTFDYVFEDLVKRIEAWNRTEFKEEVNPPVLRGTDCFEDNDVLYFFENHYKFSSQRKQFMVQECEMLERGVHPTKIPDSWILDDVLQAFLTPQNVVQVGKKIYWFKTEKTTITINDGNRRTLDELLQGKSPFKCPNVDINADERDIECDSSFELAGSDGLTATFEFTGTPTALSNPDATIEYFWTFSDGQTSSEQNPTHTFPEFGSHEACLSVEVREGEEYCQSDIFCIPVEFVGSCGANFDYENVPGSPGFISFTDKSNFLIPDADDIVSWSWSFGAVVEGSDDASEQENPIIKYPCNGNYYVTLNIITENGCEAEKTSKKITVTNYDAENCCGTGFEKDEVEYQGGDKLIRYKQKEQNIPLLRGPRAKLKNYKRRNNGNWKKHKGDLKITISGEYWKQAGGCNCGNSIDFEKTSTVSNKKKLVIRKASGQNPIKSKKNNQWEARYEADGFTHSADTNVTCD